MSTHSDVSDERGNTTAFSRSLVVIGAGSLAVEIGSSHDRIDGMIETMRFFVAAGLALLVAFHASTVHAQSATEIATRRELLRSADEARAAGRHADALEIAQRAAAVEMTPSLRLFIATEEATLGHWTAAAADAALCAREARASVQLANRAAIEHSCSDLATESESHVGRIVVHVPAALLPGLRVTVASDEIRTALLGAPVVVDPGDVVVRANADGVRRPFEQHVQVAAGTTVDVAIRFEQPEVSSSPPPSEATQAPPTASTAPVSVTAATSSPPPSPTAETRDGPLAGPIVVMVIGAAALASSGAFYALQTNALSHCASLPDGSLDCLHGDANDARTWNAATNAAWIGGAAIVAAGAAWLIVGRIVGRRHAERAVSISPLSTGVVLSIGGRW